MGCLHGRKYSYSLGDWQGGWLRQGDLRGGYPLHLWFRAGPQLYTDSSDQRNACPKIRKNPNCIKMTPKTTAVHFSREINMAPNHYHAIKMASKKRAVRLARDISDADEELSHYHAIIRFFQEQSDHGAGGKDQTWISNFAITNSMYSFHLQLYIVHFSFPLQCLVSVCEFVFLFL